MGAGFITPLSVNYSMMVGAVVSSGIAWPLLRNRAGDWFPAGLGLFNFQGEFAYHVSAPAPLPHPTPPDLISPRLNPRSRACPQRTFGCRPPAIVRFSCSACFTA